MALVAAVVGPLVTLALAWLVGSSLTARWDAVKKQTELDLSAMEQFYQLYGEFFAVWKLWDDATRRQEDGKRAELLERIANAEGQLEALVVRIACQRSLTDNQQHTVGAFRQAYQTLRRSTRHGQSLSADCSWDASNAVPYAAFNGLGASVAVLLRPQNVRPVVWRSRSGPDPLAAATLRVLTSSAYEPWEINDSQQVVVWEVVARRQGLLDLREEWPPPLVDGSPYYHEDAIYALGKQRRQPPRRVGPAPASGSGSRAGDRG